jgi:hypothetical protein
MALNFLSKIYAIEISIKSFKWVSVDKKILKNPNKWVLSIQYGQVIFENYSGTILHHIVHVCFTQNPIFGT